MKAAAFILMAALAVTAACRNDAITFAKRIDSRAKCDAVETSYSYGCSRTVPDRAICRVGDQIWTCVAGDGVEPKCERIRYNEPPVTPEAKP